ncbi:MAG: TetR/AcrR family transcriptional regulator C-terminal domain-containing protein [Phycisphaerales bacterium]|nr:TetR/AcrR family transcriptional regulator C-terminal domain-containing protein [Phycisphaerales bacterium]
MKKAARSNRRPKPTRTPLTRERIVAAAIELIERPEQGGVSMRQLGRALSVEAMALYNHFENREAILDAVADSVFEAVAVPDAHRAWDQRLRALAITFRQVAIARPSVFKVAMERPTKPARALPIMEAVFAALADAGLSGPARVDAYFTLSAFIRGFLLWEIDQICSHATGQLQPSALTPFPQIQSLVGEIASAKPERLYLRGVDLMLRGLRHHDE